MPDRRTSARLTNDISRRRLLLSLGVTGLAAMASRNARADDVSVTLDAARTALEGRQAVLIDIREPAEHATGVAAGARLLPMKQLAARLSEIPRDSKVPVLLICNTQNRSSATLKALRERDGYSHVRFVQGGMSEWVRRGWPTVAPPR